MRFVRLVLLAGLIATGVGAFANVFGSVRGVIHDPQHRPVQDAMVMLKAKSSDWMTTANSDVNGNFVFNAVPLGEYVVTIAGLGFQKSEQSVVVTAGTQPVLHFALSIGGSKESVTVSGAPESAPTDSATPITLVSRLDVAHTPGAARSNSLAMITDYVPGAYVTHDQLHIRGGHQTSWLIDGVPVPNTNIASNLGPQFDPKDIDYMEVDRGSYGFAYYASVNGNRSNLGIETPVPQVVHDAAHGYGGFGSLIFNVDPSNQLRLVTSLRKDSYQIPYDPFPNDIENAPTSQNGFVAQFPSLNLRDSDREGDALVNFSWVHTFNPRLLLTVSPFYHYNRANYDSSANDPIAATQDRNSTYAGGQASFSANLAKNNLQVGIYSFYQKNNEFFGTTFNDGSGNTPFTDSEHPSGSLAAFFIDDKFKPFSWLTLSAGIRPTHFSGDVMESAISPRFGIALNVPRLKWTFRAFYGHYYQAPPLVTASGPLIQLCQNNSCGFIPLHGERDEEHQFGVTIPFRGWVIDADNFRTNARNFFDHNSIGGSNLFFSLTISQAIIRGWEVTLRSPRIARRGQAHLAYSNQIAEAGGAISGGLTDFSLPKGFSPLDHDQRHTLNFGGDLTLPWRAYASMNVYYGSGFSNAFLGQPYPGAYLPTHTTFDLTVGKDFGERFSASLNALNVANRRVELDNSVTFGGFHWNNPREIFVEMRYRFHY